MGARWSASLMAAMVMVTVSVPVGCASGPQPDQAIGRGPASSDGSPRWGRDAAAGVDARTSRQGPRVEAADTGRFTLRLERGVVGVAELDATIEGSFDHRMPASEVIVDLRALAEPLTTDPGLEWPADAPTEVVVRQVGDHLFVHTGAEPFPWLVFPSGTDPLGAHELLSAHDPGRLLRVLERSGVEVSTLDGGTVDAIDTLRHSGWLAGSAVGDVDHETARVVALAGLVPAELLDRLVRFDLWVGVDDGVARRLVLEWDLDSLAGLARRLDGTDQGIDRLRYRTVVEWFDLGADVRIEAPPRHLVGVIDPTAASR
jgi:hypothetical protein